MTKHASAFQQQAAAVAEFGLEADVTLPWLTPRGHLSAVVQARVPRETLAALDMILHELGGDRQVLAAKTRGSMRADFVLLPRRTHVEYDEIQHFTSARMRTLALYPDTVPLAFDPEEYGALADTWRVKGDKAFAHKQAAEFPGASGRMRQRAYFDAFRDLVAPCFGDGPVLRVAAPANDYGDAVEQLVRMAAGSL